MKKLFVTFALALALIGQNLQGAEKYKTLVVKASATTATYNIPAGELCQVLYVYLTNRAQLTATIAGASFVLDGNKGSNNYKYSGVFSLNASNFDRSPNIMIAGPATITFIHDGPDGGAADNFCTLRLIPTPNINGVGQ